MSFFADLHIHSKYSQATSKYLDIDYIDYYARLKGLSVVGTGDFTHPLWMSTLEQKLSPTAIGLYALAPQHQRPEATQRQMAARDVYFIPTAEVSCVYKRNGITHRNHILLIAPDFDAAKALNKKLSSIGNLTADGRPTLSIDAQHLLDIVLQCNEKILFVPAHIWTPWFSTLGSRSGFDSIAECFGAQHTQIHAIETGLSSDMAMNRRCSFLDPYTLLSNSDAHAPDKLGRNANRFDTTLSLEAIYQAIIHDKNTVISSVDSFPQGGKYYLDGHRKCGIRLTPEQSIAKKNICPICNKPLTLGVLHRIEQIADRPDTGLPASEHTIPLIEILAEINELSSSTKKVNEACNTVLNTIGSEIDILLNTPISTIAQHGGTALAEAITKMRRKEINTEAGYDGVFGSININKRQPEILQSKLTALKPGRHQKQLLSFGKEIISNVHEAVALSNLQQEAVKWGKGVLLLSGAPKSGKTEVMCARVAYLVNEGIKPESLLIFVNSQRARQIVREKIETYLNDKKLLQNLQIETLYTYALQFLRKYAAKFGRKTDFVMASPGDAIDLLQNHLAQNRAEAELLEQKLSKMKHKSLTISDLSRYRMFDMYHFCETYFKRSNMFDINDLLIRPLHLMSPSSRIVPQYTARHEWIFADNVSDYTSTERHFFLSFFGQGSNVFATFANTNARTTRNSIDAYFEQNPDTANIRVKKHTLNNLAPLTTMADCFAAPQTENTPTPPHAPTPNVAELVFCPSENAELRYIVQKALDVRNQHMADMAFNTIEQQHITIFYQSRAQQQQLAKLLADKEAAFRILERNSLFDNALITEIIQLLKIKQYPNNRHLKQVVKDKGYARLPKWVDFQDIAEDKSLTNNILRIVDNHFEHNKADNYQLLQHLLDIAASFGDDTNAFLDYVSLAKRADEILLGPRQMLLAPMQLSGIVRTKYSFVASATHHLQLSELSAELRLQMYMAAIHTTNSMVMTCLAESPQNTLPTLLSPLQNNGDCSLVNFDFQNDTTGYQHSTLF